MARRFLTSIDLNKNEIQNARAHVLAAAPSTPATGQFYYDSVTNKLYYWNGSGWVATDGTSIFATPAIVLGTAAAAGVATTTIRSDATILAFDASVPSTQVIGDAAAVGVAAVAARRDHKHAMPVFGTPAVVLGTAAAVGVATTLLRTDATIVAFDVTNPTTSAVGQAAAVGTAAVAARRDHVHGREAFAAPTAETVFGSSSAAGSATTLPRADHTHGNPTHLNADHSAINLSALAAPTADVAWGGFKITGLGTPTATTDAVNKSYVDAVKTGLDFKDSARAATTAAIGGATYNATGGTSARGQFTTMPNTIDGVTLAANDRVLVKDQAAGAQNGIYVVTTLGSGANGVWDRATDFDADVEVTSGAFVFVTEGTTNADSGWVLSTNDPIIIGGASGTALVWVQFSGAGQITAGTGMSKTGNTLNVGAGATPGSGGPGGGLVVNADDAVIDTAVVVRKYAASVGDGAALAYVLTHNLNTQDVVVKVRDNSSPFAYMDPDIEATSVNTVTVRFTIAPTTNQYRVIIHA